jgi:hypothetical protein
LTLSNQMLDGELAPEVETESITPGSAQLADPSGASVGAGGVTNCRRSNASTRTYSEPEMGFEPMTCALRGPSKASSWVPPVRNASHKGRSTGVKLETVAIRCNSLRRPETQLLGQNSLFPS